MNQEVIYFANVPTTEPLANMEQAKINLIYDMAELFKVFGDSTRLRILTALCCKPLCVCHMAEALQMQQSAISHQLRLLRNSGLVRAKRSGKTMVYSLDDNHVACILDCGLEHLAHKQEVAVRANTIMNEEEIE